MVAGKIKFIISTMIACALLAFQMNNAHADAIVVPDDPYGNLDIIRQLSEQGKIMPLRELLKKGMPYVHGRIIEAGLELEHKQFLYEIEYIDSTGKVHEVFFKADNGKLFIPSSPHDNESDDEKEEREQESN